MRARNKEIISIREKEPEMKIEAEIIEGNPAKRIIQKLRARFSGTLSDILGH
jgi:hypothetical protein